MADVPALVLTLDAGGEAEVAAAGVVAACATGAYMPATPMARTRVISELTKKRDILRGGARIHERLGIRTNEIHLINESVCRYGKRA